MYHCKKMKTSIEDFFSKCDQIRRKLQIWSHLLNKSSGKLHFYVMLIAGVRWGREVRGALCRRMLLKRQL